MKVGYIILCRYNSSRLPGKILLPIKGKTILEILIERLRPLSGEIIVATSCEDSDNAIVSHAEKYGVKTFRGSLKNVAERFLLASREFNLDYAVRVNGDNLFADPNLIDNLINIGISANFDFVSNIPGRTFPTGVSVEVLKVAFYERIFNLFEQTDDFEHVTSFIYNNPLLCTNSFFVQNTEVPSAVGEKLAIDTMEDFLVAEQIIEKLGEGYITASWEKIVNVKHRL